MSYRLVVREGKDAGRVIPLAGTSVTLGRPGSDVAGAIEFEEPSVSRVHAILQWREEQQAFELSNRSLTSPTLVDGQPATSGRLLSHGSVIQLGSLVAELQLDGAAPEAATEEPLMGCLELVQGAMGSLNRFKVYRRRSFIGRSAGCDICLPTRELDRQHAVLDWYDELPLLMPLTSRTILVNGQPIPRGTFLAPHDWIILGSNVSMRWLPAGLMEEEPVPVLAAAPEAPEPPPPPPVQVAPEPPPPPPPKTAPRISLRARASFFADLLRQLEAGEPIRRAVETAAQERLPQLAEPLTQEILAGRSLADALGRFPQHFKPYEVGMIAAGEEAGTLDGQLRVLAGSMKGAVALRSRLWGWMLPGLLVLGLGLPMVALRPLLQERGGAVFMVAVLSAMAATTGLALLLAAARNVLGRLAGYRRLEEDVLERLPLIGEVLRLRAGGRFLRSLGPLLASGLRLQRAALLAAGCTGSTKHAISLLEAARRIERGSPVLDSLAPTGLLSSEVLAEVGKGEEQGDLPDRLAAAAERLHVAATHATHAAFPVVVAALTALLAVLMLASLALVRASLG